MAKQQRRRQQKGGAVLALSPAPFQVEAIKNSLWHCRAPASENRVAW